MPLRIAEPYRSIAQTKFGGLYTEADPRALPMGASPFCTDVDFQISGFGPRPGQTLQALSFSPSSPAGVFQYLKSAVLLGAVLGTFLQDSGGALWWETLASPGVFNRIYSGILNSPRATAENVADRLYICLSDLTAGSDQPRQYDGTFLDRISQTGPGAGPIAPASSSPVYGVVSAIQPWPAISIDSISWGSQINLYNAQPASRTIFFLGRNVAFTTGLNVGDTIYVSGAGTLEGLNPNGTYVVTGIGTFNDQDGTYWYFSVVSDLSNSDFARGTAGGTYQKTQAVVQLSSAIPAQESAVGEEVSISGNSVQGWNNTWKILGTPAEGQLNVSATSLTSNLASFTYALQSGNGPGWQPSYAYAWGSQIVDGNGSGHVWQVTTPGTSGGSTPSFPASPSPGATVTDGGVTWTYQSGAKMLVTVFNTSNGSGIFNVQAAQILSANTTTFTVALTSQNISSAAEAGEAVSGSGIMLVIDPGTITLGSGHPGTSPIYGTGTGGSAAPQGTGQVAAGRRYAILIFKTRNGYLTPASPPVAFYTTGATTQVTFTNLAIGPPNVIARIVAMTLANADIQGPYFYVPDDVILQGSAASLGQTVTINKSVLPDNTSTTLGPITIEDSVLSQGVNVTAPGNNLLLQRELGESAKCVLYAGRTVFIGERVKVDEFLNPTFDGGSISGLPAGWTLVSGVAPILVTSPIFGQSAQFGGSQGTLQQGAYETAFQTPILVPATAYSVRVTAFGSGSLTIQLVDGANVYAFTPTLQAGMKEFVGAFSNPLWNSVPSDLVLQVIGQNVTVDRIEIFPTLQPVYANEAAVSYIENYEAIDGATGNLDISRFTSKPIVDAYVFLDRLFLVTATGQGSSGRTFAVTDSDGQEPSSWDIREVANAAGGLGPLSGDVGEEYRLQADRPGLYLFDGGAHINVSKEIQKIWDLIYWPSAKTVWVKNDLSGQRILVGVPLPTPNPWLPNAPSNPTPSTPNMILVCSYLTLPNGTAIAEGLAVAPSVFTGHLLYHDGRRKWTIWQIATPYADFIDRADSTRPLWLAGSAAQALALDPQNSTDNGNAIPETYWVSPLPDSTTEMQLQLGPARKLFPFATILAEGTGQMTVTAWPESPSVPSYFALNQAPFTLQKNASDDLNVPLAGVSGNRLFLALATDGKVMNGVGSTFSITKAGIAMLPATRARVVAK